MPCSTELTTDFRQPYATTSLQNRPQCLRGMSRVWRKSWIKNVAHATLQGKYFLSDALVSDWPGLIINLAWFSSFKTQEYIDYDISVSQNFFSLWLS